MLPHIRIPFMQENIVSLTQALDLAMKLESSPIGEIGAGMMKIQLQLVNLTLQLQNIKKGKDIQEEM